MSRAPIARTLSEYKSVNRSLFVFMQHLKLEQQLAGYIIQSGSSWAWCKYPMADSDTSYLVKSSTPSRCHSWNNYTDVSCNAVESAWSARCHSCGWWARSCCNIPYWKSTKQLISSISTHPHTCCCWFFWRWIQWPYPCYLTRCLWVRTNATTRGTSFQLSCCLPHCCDVCDLDHAAFQPFRSKEKGSWQVMDHF